MSRRDLSLRPPSSFSSTSSSGTTTNTNTKRKESVGRLNQRQVSISDPDPGPSSPPVTVAVLAPRLPSGPAAPRTGVPMADVFNWDEAINYTPSAADLARQQKLQASKNPFKRGLTTQRLKANPDLPPFVMRQVPYEVWRMHYAKDKEGNYRGTHAPAEDCLLRPHDVDKWRFKGDGGEDAGDGSGGGDVFAGKFTRGKEVLPVYNEVKEEGPVPGYEVDYDPDPDNADVDVNATKGTNEDTRRDHYNGGGEGPPPLEERPPAPPPPPPPTPLEQVQGRDVNSGLPYDAQREREALKERNQGVKGWKSALKRGLEMAAMGGGGSG